LPAASNGGKEHSTVNETFTLYHLASCPFCLKVRRAAAALGVELELVDIAEQPWARDHLVHHKDRATVPVLGIRTPDGEALLPESDDIIGYLLRYQRTAA
jgi:glutaredoxin